MSALSCNILDMQGKQVESIALNPSVFQAKLQPAIIHQTVRWQLAKRRSGTHQTLTKGMMKGGNRKPWKQKGTGRARSGSNTSPVWVGGGVAHGPQPRSYEFRLAKRTKRQALTSVLSAKLKKGRLIVLDSLALTNGKTKEVLKILENLGLSSKKSLILLEQKDQLALRAARNIRNVSTLSVAGVNVYDLLRHQYVVCTKEGILSLQSRLEGNS